MKRTRTLAVVGVVVSLLVGHAAAQVRLASPISAQPGNDTIREVTLDAGAVGRLRQQRAAVTLTGFPMPGGRSVDLRLEPFEVLTPDAAVVLATADGEVEIGRPEVSLFHGEVVGEPGSRVFLSLSSFGTHALIQSAGSTVVLSEGGLNSGLPLVVADLADFPEPPEFAKGWECGVGPEHINPLGLDLAALAGDGTLDPQDNPCRIARVAIEGDYEYTAWLFGGDAEASAAYAVTLLGAVSEIYTRDLNVRLLVPFIRLWETENDPYEGDKLAQFRAEWNANMRHVQREVAHLLSGNYGGGVAWVSVVCHNSYGYGLSGVAGSFPYPLRDHDGGNWDLFVVAHELGHNFGTLHTHDGYDPTIDDCGNGDCSQAWGGTIMSYCHTCAGGMTNIVLAFHPRVITQISAYLDGACNILGESRAFAYDDTGVTVIGVPVRVDVLANDIPLNCSTPGIFSVSPTTEQGGAAAVSFGTGEGGRDEILYTPPAGFTGADRAEYLVQTSAGALTSAMIDFEVLAGRTPDTPRATRPGARVRYFVGDPRWSQLPDFENLQPYGFDLLPQINFPSGTGNFATSGRGTDVAARFETGITIDQPGIYTLFLDSDDVSRLFIDGEVVVENDGLHTMTEQSGQIGLLPGLHLLRIEFFERGGTQGLIASIEGPGLPKQVVPTTAWRTADCIGDWVVDGTVNTVDVLGFLASWGQRDPAADLDNSGTINSIDVILFLGEWAAGC